MRIGINVIGLFPGKIGGAEQYIRNIINHIVICDDMDIFLFLNNEAFDTFQELRNLHKYSIALNQDIETQLLYYIDYLNIDIWFCPLFHLLPSRCPIPSAVAIFDIQQEYYPLNFKLSELIYRKRYTRHTVKEANLILTISEFSKKTIQNKYKPQSNNIKVTYLDSDSAFLNTISDNDIKNAKIIYELPEEYMLYPANTWPHKNHLRLVKAYHLLKTKYNIKTKLVFTGAKKGTQNNIENYIKRHQLDYDIIYLGYVKQEDMPYIFANAQVVVFPSLFEGFGIPVIEAMRVGVPVVCSNSTSLPEIAEGAALYFNPYSIKDIANKIYSLINNNELRDSLLSKANIRSQKFSWKKCADETITYIKTLYNKPGDKKVQKQEWPLVSIITPSYNQGQFIKETIDSVLSQDYSNLEYIVMDGGSTDNTVDILRSYGDKIKWVSEKDGGQADAVNKGIKVAKGQIIGWLNSDDTYLEGAVSKAVEYFMGHSEVDMVYGEGYYIDKNGNFTERYATEKYSIARLAEICYICQPTAFFRKDIVNKVNGLDAKLHLCMDYELWMKFAFIGRISYIPEYLATSRMYEENKTLSRKSEVYSEVCSTVKKHYKYVPMTWIYGYASFLNNGRINYRFYMKFLALFIKYNFTNPRFMFRFALHYFIKKISSGRIKPSHDAKFVDGWVSKKYRTAVYLRKPVSNIRIKGRHIWPRKEELVIKIIIDKNYINSWQLSTKGDFECQYELSNVLQAGQHDVELVMNDTFIPSKHGMGGDTRNLSFILDDIIFE